MAPVTFIIIDFITSSRERKKKLHAPLQIGQAIVQEYEFIDFRFSHLGDNTNYDCQLTRLQLHVAGSLISRVVVPHQLHVHLAGREQSGAGQQDCWFRRLKRSTRRPGQSSSEG